jgi:hypothetical protein
VELGIHVFLQVVDEELDDEDLTFTSEDRKRL